MLLGGNIILLEGDYQDVDEIVSELKKKKRVRFIGELPGTAHAVMGFSALTIGLVTLIAGVNEAGARETYQQIVETIGNLSHGEVRQPVTSLPGLVWMEMSLRLPFTCGVVFGKDRSFSFFHTDVISGDDAIGTLQELLAEEVKEQREPQIVASDDWGELEPAEET